MTVIAGELGVLSSSGRKVRPRAAGTSSRREIAGADIFAAEPFRFTGIRNTEFSCCESRHRFKRGRQVSCVLKLGVRPWHCIDRSVRRCICWLDNYKTIRISVRSGSKDCRVEQAEDRRRRTDA